MDPALFLSAIPAVLVTTFLSVLWLWRQDRRDAARTRETLARLDHERRAELDKLELTGRLDPFVRGAIAGGQVGVGRSVPPPIDGQPIPNFGPRMQALHTRMEELVRSQEAFGRSLKEERTARGLGLACDCQEKQAEVEVELAALRADVNRLLAERPQGYRRAG